VLKNTIFSSYWRIEFFGQVEDRKKDMSLKRLQKKAGWGEFALDKILTHLPNFSDQKG